MGFEEQMHEMESRWQQAWDDEDVFEVDPDPEKDSFFITVAYPYPSGGMHIGHVRTYTLPDVFARYKRMQGNNVLFPMAWHVTGTPIIGAANRLENREPSQVDTLTNTYNVPEEDFEKLEDPLGYAEYFIDDYRTNMQRLGYGVDWRREFTTNDDRYNKFIEWQYRTLREKGLVKKGKHPTKYCIDEQNPVTTHDLLEGEDAEKQEYTLVRFQDGQTILPMATLRPETVYGVTHALVDPEGEYVRATVDGEEWIISRDAVTKLEHQDHDVSIEDELKGEELVGREVMNPVTGDTIMLLPATFVDTGSASGIVMSVPAHAPYDWISLQDIKERADDLEEYGIDPETVRNIEPISIIDVEGYGEYPAQEACEAYGIGSQDDEDKLEEATEEIYKKEHHTGRLKPNCQEFAGDTISGAKERLIDLYENQNKFGTMWDFSEPVVCRCGADVVVAESDTWFLEYGSKAWKDKADSVLNQLETIPEGTRDDYEHTINWLESWPCIRNYGLGTKLPFDDEFVVEPLSDSTIYMAYYTIKHKIEDIPPEKLTKPFFDYVFRGKGPVEDVAEQTGVSEETLKDVRESFEYWYPLDWRTSANELVQNHLTFFMFHHAALFDEQHWPNGVAAWGMGLLEGQKMSSSKGHVVLANKAIERYGADTVRFFMFSSCEPWQDFDWRQDEVEEAKQKIESFYHRTKDLYDSGEQRELNNIDKYLLSRLHSSISDAEEAMEDFQTRKASITIFHQLNNALRWYKRRAEKVNTEVINTFLEAQVRMMAPFIPHVCEELWADIGDGLLVDQDWPTVDEDMIQPAVEYGEQFVQDTLDDIREIGSMVEDYDHVRIVLASPWKRDAVSMIMDIFDEDENLNMGTIMDTLTDHQELSSHGSDLADLGQHYADDPGQLPERQLSLQDEHEVLKEATLFIERQFDADVTIEREDASDHSKADRAKPGKPAIILE